MDILLISGAHALLGVLIVKLIKENRKLKRQKKQWKNLAIIYMDRAMQYREELLNINYWGI